VIIVGFAIALYPNYQRRNSLIAKEAEYSRLIEEKKLEIADLREKQSRFQNDTDFIESIARQNNRVYPGELVFIFED
jgi:cell division protein FtsB